MSEDLVWLLEETSGTATVVIDAGSFFGGGVESFSLVLRLVALLAFVSVVVGAGISNDLLESESDGGAGAVLLDFFSFLHFFISLTVEFVFLLSAVLDLLARFVSVVLWFGDFLGLSNSKDLPLNKKFKN